MAEIVVREARAEDAAEIAAMIRRLAVFERLADQAHATEADLLRDGFGEEALFGCLVAEVDGVVQGFALFFTNYSTFEGRPGLYLEDIFVEERSRGLGIGRRLVEGLAAVAVERGLPRLELSVLHWNPAREFYAHLGFEPLRDWRPYRLSGDALRALASRGREPA